MRKKKKKKKTTRSKAKQHVHAAQRDARRSAVDKLLTIENLLVHEGAVISDATMTKLLGREVRREVVVGLAFAAGVMACLISGTLYAVSLWLPQVKVRLHFSQTETNLVGGAGSLGQYLGFLSGLLNDLTSSRVAMLAGAAALGVGYGLLALAAGGYFGEHCPWWLVAGFLFLAGLGR